MPTVTLIDDEDLQERVVETIRELPAYFWEAPATSSEEYHNRYARGERGLWTHVLMCATAVESLKDSYVERGRLNDEYVDYARAAILLHDGWKYGDEWTAGESAERDHDLRGSRELSARGFPGAVCNAVATHMGPWYDGPPPTTPLERFVHLADMVGSRRHVTPAVYDAPEEIIAANPEIPRCEWSASEPRRSDD